MSLQRTTFSTAVPDTAEVRSLVEAARAVDGTAALNEAAMISINHGGPERQVTAHSAEALIGYGLLADGHVQVVVDPDHRRSGVATGIVAELSDHPRSLAYWAFGDLAGARAWAAARGAEPVRKLLIMERSPAGPVEVVPPPAGVTIRGYRAEDAEELIAVNARAFSHHPEQGAMDAADLASRMSEDWYRPEDLLVATVTDADGRSRLTGFHWTKQHDAETGEVYVLAVDPEAGGGGIGRALLTAGLQHLVDLGKQRVILYVEDDQPRVVEIYRRAGFEVIHQDVVYAFPGADSDRV
ncbi:mycothiol synthase [Naumannella halotolerans]|uniref:Mycothiol acetyltransferase n=1 Tax=Naumannella halotolerans TaxID=993414 RepID=A0A4R7IZ55_9ACTN|nr:mycothiol synthase [Naumannella halotolerans]TDT30010.1 mycothiol synthase [Naumannella halotolerans]